MWESRAQLYQIAMGRGKPRKRNPENPCYRFGSPEVQFELVIDSGPDDVGKVVGRTKMSNRTTLPTCTEAKLGALCSVDD
jgi:hypothetical protein